MHVFNAFSVLSRQAVSDLRTDPSSHIDPVAVISHGNIVPSKEGHDRTNPKAMFQTISRGYV